MFVIYLLFRRFKAELHGHCHQNLEDLKVSVTYMLKVIPPTDYSAAMHSLAIRWMKCIAADGTYFEGMHFAVDPHDHSLEVTLEDSESEDSD